MESAEKRLDLDLEQEKINGMKRLYKNEKSMFEEIRAKIEGLDPIEEGAFDSKLYKISDSCYVFVRDGLYIVTNSPDINDCLCLLNGHRLSYMGKNDMVSRTKDGQHFPDNGTYICELWGSIVHITLNEGRVFSYTRIEQNPNGERSYIVDASDMTVSKDGECEGVRTELIEYDPTKDTAFDYESDFAYREEGRSPEKARLIRVLKNDRAGLMEQMGIEGVEHVPDADMRAIEMRRRDEALTAENARLTARITALEGRNAHLRGMARSADGRARDAEAKNGELESEVESLKSKLETSREETESQKRKFKALLDAIGKALEKAKNAGRLTSPKAIAEMIKNELSGQMRENPDAPDASDDGENR